MKKEELEYILKFFTEYSDNEYSEYLSDPRKAKWYLHRGDDNFHIIVFDDDNSVYQLDNDSQTFGIELKDLESLAIRYYSMTGDEITNIRFREGENPCEIVGHDWRYNFVDLPSKRICAVCKRRETFDAHRLDWLDVPFQDSRSEEELINAWFK